MKLLLTRAVAVLQVIGGLLGIGLGATVFGSQWSSSPAVTIAYMFAFTFTFVAGILLWAAHPIARSVSVLVQACQVVTLVVNGWGFQFFAGFLTRVSYDTGHFNLLFGPGAAFVLATGEDPSQLLIGINFVPLVALFVLSLRDGFKEISA